MHNKSQAKPVPAQLPAPRVAVLDSLHLVLRETRRQDAKWGVREQDTGMWNKILMEEVGETAEAALQMDFDGATSEHYEEEMIQVAAVAIQAATDLRLRRLAANANPRTV